ncbi:Sec-independent protein translocase TatB [Luteimicrobium sp. DT211]|uniref:Sec-independent protein translocase TatB n=1 Tax=Luteimicrobium sp. DT211 TaxID=3393412 RepID=UPI003CE7430C
MLDINGGELLVIAVLAAVLIGPERLPEYVKQVTAFARTARTWVVQARDRVTDELGPEGAGVDWAQLDPRRYDPRSIVREALLEDLLPGGVRRPAASVEDVVVRLPPGAVELPGPDPVAAPAAAGRPSGDVPGDLPAGRAEAA